MSDAPEPASSPPAPPAPEDSKMEFHKPKPIHNWREFLKEVGTIVLGVCIALAAEQGVEWWHWRNQVREAREVIATEMALNLVGAIIRLRTEGCIEHRLDTLADILDAASRSGQLPPVGEIGQPPPRLWRYGAWESVVAAETATHFPRKQLADIGSLYQLVGRMEGLTQPNLMAWNDLYSMVGPGRRLDPAAEANLRKALSFARAVNRNYASLAMTMVARTQALGLPFNSEDLKQIEEARRQPLTELRPNTAQPDTTLALCGPIGAVPPRYSQSQFSGVPAFADQTLKTLPDFGAP